MNEFHRLAAWYTNELIPCLIVFTWDWKSNGPLRVSYGLLFNVNNMFMNFGLRGAVDQMTMSDLYLPQYQPDPFHIYTSYQPTSEGVSYIYDYLISQFDTHVVVSVTFDMGSGFC